MSIATDEAAQKYPAPTDAGDPMYKYVEAIAGYPSAKRQGYIAGRTAEPTEAEIEASAFGIYRVIANNGFPTPDNALHQIWDATPDNQRDMYRGYAKAALAAARKAVSVDE
jgi:hypothetical protein